MNNNTRMARCAQRINKMNSKLKRKRFPITRTRKIPYLSKWQMRKAIKGSKGIITVIAKRLQVSAIIVERHLQLANWELVRIAYRDECNVVNDIAEDTLHYAMSQRLDLPLAAKTAQWWLSKKKLEFKESSTVKVEGGDNPIKILQANIPVEALQLSPEIMRQILDAVEKREKEQQGIVG